MRFLLGFPLLLIPLTSTRAQVTWTRSTLPTGSNVHALSVDQRNVLYAAAWGAGVFRSTDKGAHWLPLRNGLIPVNIHDLTINDSGFVFAGSWGGGGVYRSTNAGGLWTAASSGLPAEDVYDLTVSPSGEILAVMEDVVFRSTDLGDSWSLYFGRFHNSISGRYASARLMVYVSAGSFYVGTDTLGLIQWTGSAWRDVSLTYPVQNVTAFLPVTTSWYYQGLETYGLWRSTNTGANWTLLLAGVTPKAILFHSPNTLIVATAAHGVRRSVNGGVDWELATGITTGALTDLTYTSDGTLFASTGSRGVFASTDLGATWNLSSNGLTDIAVTSLATDGASFVVAGTEGGVYRSTDAGASFLPCNDGVVPPHVLSVAFDGGVGVVLAGTNGARVFRSANNGDSWKALATWTGDSVVQALAANPTSHYFAGTSTSGVFRSTDKGGSWTHVISGLTTQDVRALIAGKSNAVVAGTWGGGFFRSTDNGASWTPANSGLGDLQISALVANASDHLFAATRLHGVYRSTNGGTLWTAANTGLPASTVVSLAVTSGNLLFAGTLNDGIYYSTDAGAHWTAVNSGLTTPDIRALLVASTGRLLAGTYGDGVFRTLGNPTEVGERTPPLPTVATLEVNYPNPFNPATTIRFQLPDSRTVLLEVFNSAGQRVGVLAEGKWSAGTHEVRFDASSLSSGIYYYRLRAGDFTATKKAVYLR
jgi:ligand-binding sensor domain-containing protein